MLFHTFRYTDTVLHDMKAMSPQTCEGPPSLLGLQQSLKDIVRKTNLLIFLQVGSVFTHTVALLAFILRAKPKRGERKEGRKFCSLIFISLYRSLVAMTTLDSCILYSSCFHAFHWLVCLLLMKPHQNMSLVCLLKWKFLTFLDTL